VITAVPTAIFVTTPVPTSTVATAILPLLHVPPAGVDENVVGGAPKHTEAIPVNADGVGLTTNPTMLLHPEGAVYVITDVPGDIAVTTPVEGPTMVTGGTEVLQLQVPPEGPEVSVVFVPAQTVRLPDIGSGSGRTVKSTVVKQAVGPV